jgi:hypothetical protein
MSTVSTDLANSLEQLVLWWRNRLGARRALDELNRSPHAEFLRTARDFGVTVERLKRFAARGPLSIELMERMAGAHGLEPDALRRADLNAVREMEERCTLCGSRFRCAHDLAVDGSVTRTKAYCPNAEALKALKE